MIDRLVHHAEIIALKGDSYRLRDKNLEPRPPVLDRDPTDPSRRPRARTLRSASPYGLGFAPQPARLTHTLLAGSIFDRKNRVHYRADLTEGKRASSPGWVAGPDRGAGWASKRPDRLGVHTPFVGFVGAARWTADVVSDRVGRRSAARPRGRLDHRLAVNQWCARAHACQSARRSGHAPPHPEPETAPHPINSLTKEQQKRQARSTVYLAIEMDESEQRPTRDAGRSAAAPLKSGLSAGPELTPDPDELRSSANACPGSRFAQAKRERARRRPGRPVFVPSGRLAGAKLDAARCACQTCRVGRGRPRAC